MRRGTLAACAPAWIAGILPDRWVSVGWGLEGDASSVPNPLGRNGLHKMARLVERSRVESVGNEKRRGSL